MLSTDLAGVTAVVVNYQTPDLLERAVDSFCSFYPRIPLVIVDNGSKDNSARVIESLIERHNGYISATWLNENVGHGPAMDIVARNTKAAHLFFLDSDTETRSGGFLEEMMSLARADPRILGVGEIAPINRRGYLHENGTPALVAAFMLINIELYRRLPPFRNHGAPGIDLFREAERQHYRLVDYPIQQYIAHLCRGTVRRHGYASLGLGARINHLLQKLGI